MPKRHAFVVSDRTGLTAEAMAHSLLSQFPSLEFVTETCPYIDTLDKASALMLRINQLAESTGKQPLIFLTLVDDRIRETVNMSNGVIFDLFDTFIEPMEKTLETESSHSVGKSHGVSNLAEYTSRISAVHFSLATDDGLETDHYSKAQIILTGVSRCGKTPTCLYLSLQHGVFASNFPLTDELLNSRELPKELQRHKSKVFGLTIDPFRLLQIRQERYGGETYSSANACQREVAQAESIFRAANIQCLNTTRMSVEEIGAKIMQAAGLKRVV